MSQERKPKVLLCSVFGPYGQDDRFGSRKLNPMELYHNQVTRMQGPFSLRMFHRSWGLMLIQANIDTSCVLLDFPTLDRFIQEISQNSYDIVGISSIVPNTEKVRIMCRLVRLFLPKAEVVVGGHIANDPNLAEKIDADHIVRGEGVAWFRKHLGENDENRPMRHPLIVSGFGARNCGISMNDQSNDIAATVIPSVGCPLGCNFCSTSAMFGGKGGGVNFYQTGDALFSVMDSLEQEMKVHSFFIMDENFLFFKDRAIRLLELMEQNNKAWALYVFTSARVLKSYTMDQLVRLGVSWVWMGIEGKDSQYSKLAGVDTFGLVKELQANGIHVLGSTIIGLENHRPENMDEVIDYAVKHDTDFHQFMLYTPIPGTPLYKELQEKGLMVKARDYQECDIHGQSILPYDHPFLSDEDTTRLMPEAFLRDFEVNGPSTARIVRTTLKGWQKHKFHPSLRVRQRFQWEVRNIATRFSALAGATKEYYRNNPAMFKKMSALVKDLHTEFGWRSRFYSAVGGWWLLRQIHKEEKRLQEGFSYEPPTFYERNKLVDDKTIATLCRYVIPATM
jgi:radical SAM superfamily enzyme YgiQ (UPF0313 family)